MSLFEATQMTASAFLGSKLRLQVWKENVGSRFSLKSKWQEQKDAPGLRLLFVHTVICKAPWYSRFKMPYLPHFCMYQAPWRWSIINHHYMQVPVQGQLSIIENQIHASSAMSSKVISCASFSVTQCCLSAPVGACVSCMPRHQCVI